jgi:hypothetical protein
MIMGWEIRFCPKVLPRVKYQHPNTSVAPGTRKTTPGMQMIFIDHQLSFAILKIIAFIC